MERRGAQLTARVSALVAVLWFGAVFGFFFAWVCSTLWGLDRLDPRDAIAAMNAMNEGVRNPVFFAAFFFAPVVGLVAAAASALARQRRAALLLGLASLAYAGGGIFVTWLVNVPMNDALAAGGVPATRAEAQLVWDTYASGWQRWNLARTVVSGACLLMAGGATLALGRGSTASPGGPAGTTTTTTTTTEVTRAALATT